MGTEPTGISDREGLICAFELAPLRERTGDILAGQRPINAHWLHFSLSDRRASRWLEVQSALAEPARELLLDDDPRIRALKFDGGFGVVLGDLHHDFTGDPENFGEIRVVVEADRVITARLHPLKSADRLRRELLAGEHDAPTPIAIFEHLVLSLAETFAITVADIAEKTDDMEEAILADRYFDRGRTLGAMRRLLARLRRQVSANRIALSHTTKHLPQSCTDEQRQTLRHAIERLESVAQDLELVQERARLLQEEVAGRIAEATNRNLYLLSIVTTTLLPITLITGVFGMNVGGLPWLADVGGFWWVLVLMVAAVIVTLALLRRRRVL